MNKDEQFNTKTPSAEKCKTCIFALQALKLSSGTFERYNYNLCAKYQTKPHDVLWNGAECPQYIGE